MTMHVIQNAIGGTRFTSTSARRVPVFNPATGEQSGELPLSTAGAGWVMARSFRQVPCALHSNFS